jgi:phage terminase large subunit-like protein
MCGVIAPTYGDLKRVIFSGDSGFMNIINRDLLGGAGYNKSDNEITFYNGSKIIGFPAIEPDRLRGVQFHRAWCDELASWRYRESFDNLMMALRLGQNPKCIITTTPRPTRLIKELATRSDTEVIKGNTFENIDNLAPSAVAMLKERYEGTRIGRQELYAEILEDVEGALFNHGLIDDARVREAPELERIVVAVDPAVTSTETSDETGIIVAGRDKDNHFYILQDASQVTSPDVWVKKAIELYNRYECDRIVSHVGYFKDLEEQMCQFTGNNVKSHDDRVDALVWAITSLQSSGKAIFRIS